MSTLARYELEFSDLKGYPSLIGKNPKYHVLTTFISEFTNWQEFQNDFLPYVERRSIEGLEIINDKDILGYDSNSCSIFISREETGLENSQFGFESIKIPTLDFKIICLEWLRYLKMYKSK